MSESKCEIVSEENTAVDSLADNTCGPSDDSDLARIAFAASKVTTEEEAAAVMNGLRDTEGLTESGIAPDVLSKLLPGDDVVVLSQIKQVAGGADTDFSSVPSTLFRVLLPLFCSLYPWVSSLFA